MLRVATITDFDIIKSMVIKFVGTTEYADVYDEETIDRLITEVLLAPNEEKVAFLHGDQGFIAGMINPFIFGTEYKVATELGWWVEPEARKTNVAKELIGLFEAWAIKLGAKMITLISLDEHTGKLYEKNKYKLCERAYVRKL